MKNYAAFSSILFFGVLISLCQHASQQKAKGDADDLVSACCFGELQLARELVNAGISVNCRNSQGFTALGSAVKNRKTKLVEFLVGAGADINFEDKYGWTPLMESIRLRDVGILTNLMQNKKRSVDFKRKNRAGWDVMSVAAFYGMQKDLLTFLKIKAPITDFALSHQLLAAASDTTNENSDVIMPLPGRFNAVLATVTVEKLLANGADPNTSDPEGTSALHYACNCGNLKAVELLLSKNAKINITNQHGVTPLMCAAQSGFKGGVNLLIQKKVILDDSDEHGESALMYAANFDKGEICEILINAGSSINATAKNGNTALHIAAESLKFDSASRLVRMKINTGLSNVDGKTALAIAREREFQELVQLLEKEEKLKTK